MDARNTSFKHQRFSSPSPSSIVRRDNHSKRTTFSSFLNVSKIHKIHEHLSGMTENDLKELYDTVGAKLIQQNGYVVDYNPALTAILGCHSNTLLLGSSEQSKQHHITLGRTLTKTKHRLENQSKLCHNL